MASAFPYEFGLPVLAKVRLLWAGVFLFGITSCGGNVQSPARSFFPAKTLDGSARDWVDQTLDSLSDEALVGARDFLGPEHDAQQLQRRALERQRV